MRILLADDHQLFISGLKNLLTAAGLEVVGTASDGAEALVKVRELRPEVVLMDIRMPGCDGLTATRRIKAEFPEVKIVILTMTDDDETLFEAVKSGASGYLLKNLEAEEFLELLAGLARGETALSPGLAGRLLHEFAFKREEPEASRRLPSEESPDDSEQPLRMLTPRQIEVLTLIARGLSNKEVAAELDLSVPTVKFHLHEVLERLHLENRTQTIVYAVRAKLIEEDGAPRE